MAHSFGIAVVCDEPGQPVTRILGMAMILSYLASPLLAKALKKNVFSIGFAVSILWAVWLVVRFQ
jgi:hypothetical protein